jgi:exopolysaccharide biosynthesis protein
MELDYAYDSATGANYTVIRVFQTKRDGTKQYPFIRCPGFMKAAAFVESEGWQLAINAGLGWSGEIDGVAIENGVIKHNAIADHHAGAIPLTISNNGTLSTAGASDTAETILNGGNIVSAICGFCPIIVNYAPTESFPDVANVTHFTENAQRQLIGQFGNGDYAIISCAGRNYDHSDGWTLVEAQTVCQKMGLKFAYNLDGGTSVATYLRKHAIYDYMAEVPSSSRVIPSFIVFNGTDAFSIPSANE